MSGEETYLEAFLETISALPPEVKRNLELMKDLDRTCSDSQERLRLLQYEYIRQAEEKLMALQVVEPASTNEAAGVRVMGGGPDAPVIIPTTEEFKALISDPVAMNHIRRIQEQALQQAEEKVAIADQTYAILDGTVKRLDADLLAMEQLLSATGDFQAAGTAKPNDLAAIQVTPGSPDWILAKVIKHDPNTGMYKLSDEDVESSKIFHLPEAQVVVLGDVEKLGRGDIVFAVYPDTTSFYQATVVQAPRKVSGAGSFVMVNFVDDSDEHGITHDKAVQMQHIMLPPHGVILK